MLATVLLVVSLQPPWKVQLDWCSAGYLRRAKHSGVYRLPPFCLVVQWRIDLLEDVAAAVPSVLQCPLRARPPMHDHPRGRFVMRVRAAPGMADRSRGLGGQSSHSYVDEQQVSKVLKVPRASRLNWAELRLPCVPELQCSIIAHHEEHCASAIELQKQAEELCDPSTHILKSKVLVQRASIAVYKSSIITGASVDRLLLLLCIRVASTADSAQDIHLLAGHSVGATVLLLDSCLCCFLRCLLCCSRALPMCQVHLTMLLRIFGHSTGGKLFEDPASLHSIADGGFRWRCVVIRTCPRCNCSFLLLQHRGWCASYQTGLSHVSADP